MAIHFLLVEDSPTELARWRAVVQQEWPDARIADAPSAERALQLLRAEEPDVIVADHRMAWMTGVDLLEITRRDHPRVLRILVTAADEFEVAREAINRAKVHAYVRKSDGVPVLRERLRAVVRERESAE